MILMDCGTAIPKQDNGRVCGPSIALIVPYKSASDLWCESAIPCGQSEGRNEKSDPPTPNSIAAWIAIIARSNKHADFASMPHYR